jgi:hypothetical protein
MISEGLHFQVDRGVYSRLSLVRIQILYNDTVC